MSTAEYERDYRQSHQDHGDAYEEELKTSKFLHRQWEIERASLALILNVQLRDKTRPRYLDFACGTGRIIEFCEDYMNESIGVDVSPSMLEVARNKVRRAELLCHDLTASIPPELGKFDVITAFRFFARAQPCLRTEVIEVLTRLLKDDGILIFNNHVRRERLMMPTRRLYKGIMGRAKIPHCLADAEVEALVSDIGLSIAKTIAIGAVPDRLRRVIPHNLSSRLERTVAKTTWGKRAAASKIYVCKKES